MVDLWCRWVFKIMDFLYIILCWSNGADNGDKTVSWKFFTTIFGLQFVANLLVLLTIYHYFAYTFPTNCNKNRRKNCNLSWMVCYLQFKILHTIHKTVRKSRLKVINCKQAPWHLKYGGGLHLFGTVLCDECIWRIFFLHYFSRL